MTVETMHAKDGNGLERRHDPSNDAARLIALEEPYIVTVTIRGSAPLIFHRWSVEGVAEKAAAKKGSTAKKTDDLESYVYRDVTGEITVPGTYLCGAIVGAARFKQDPRSPRKSAMDLFKAGVVSLTEHASLGTKAWDYVDRRRVCVQRNGITRYRPAFHSGWSAEFELSVLVPEYITPTLLHDVLIMAGKLIGVGDFRPTYGRFQVTKFEVQQLT